MKAKELIEKLKNYEDFDIEFHFTDGFSRFPNIRRFSVDCVEDIGHSDKVIIISGEEQ